MKQQEDSKIQTREQPAGRPRKGRGCMRHVVLLARLAAVEIGCLAALSLGDPATFVLTDAPLQADGFIKPQAIKRFGPFDRTSDLEKAAHPGGKTELADRASFREMNPELKPQIDKAKAESKAMAEKYDMVLWPDDGGEL